MQKSAPIPAVLAALMLAPALFVQSFAQPPKSQASPPSRPIFSEDFESGTIDKNLWSLDVTGDNIVQVQQDKAAHGKYALLVRCPTPAMRTHAYLTAKNLPEALRHHLFGRAYVYISPVVPDRHTVFIQAGTAGFPKSKFMEVATAHNKFQLTYTNQVDGGEDYHADGEIPLGRWFLLEWEFNDQPDSAAVWVDGQPVMDTPFTFKAVSPSTDLVGGFTDIAFGFFLRGAAPAPFDVYYDDIALDTHRIGPVIVRASSEGLPYTEKTRTSNAFKLTVKVFEPAS